MPLPEGFSSFSSSLVADCVNSSPRRFSPKFQGFGGIWANSGKFGTFQENSVGFCMVLSMNSVGISGQHRPDVRENLGFGVVSGDLGSKGFCANSQSLGD